MVIPPMTGRFVRLRCAEEGDVAFTLAIRNDPELTKILPKISNTEQEQRDWINKQRALEDSCFMVFENLEGKPLGTIMWILAGKAVKPDAMCPTVPLLRI